MVINSNGIAALLLFFNLRKWFQKKNSGRGKEKRSLSYKIKSSLADTGVYLTYSQSIPSSYVAKAMQIIIVAKCTLLTVNIVFSKLVLIILYSIHAFL